MKRVVQVDAETGEMLEGAVLGMFFPKRQNGFNGGWLAMAQDALMALAKADLGDEARRVLFAILARLDFENYILLNQAELAESIGLKRGNFSRAVARLEEHGIIVRGPKAGRSVTFRLNPSYGWKGSASNHREALRARMKTAGLSVVKSEPARDPKTVDAFTGKADFEVEPPYL